MRRDRVRLLVQAYFRGVRPFSRMFQINLRKGSRHPRLHAVLLGIVFCYGFGAIAVMLGYNYLQFGRLGMLLGIDDLSLTIALAVAFLVTFLFGVFSIPALLYRGKDEQLLMTLPVSHVELVASRLVVAYISYAFLYAFLTVPALVAEAVVKGLSVPLVVGGLLLLLSGPVFPVLAGSLIATLVVWLSRGRRHRNLDQIVMTLLIIGIALVPARYLTVYGDMQISEILGILGPSLKRLHGALQPFVWQASMAVRPIAAVSACILAILCMALLCWGVSKGFRHWFSLSLGTAERKRKTAGKRKSDPVSRSLHATLVKRELEIIQGESVFKMEIFGEIFIPVILIVVYLITGVLQDVGNLVAMVGSFAYREEALLLVLALFGNITVLSSTSVSRQGRLFELDRSLPIESRQLVAAKIDIHLRLFFLPNVCYLLAACLLLHVSLLSLLWMVPLSLLLVLTCASLGLAIDFSRPILDWDLPQQAMKSNLNGGLGMVASLVVLVLVGASLVLPRLLWSFPQGVGIAGSFVVALVISLVARRICLRRASDALAPV